MIGNKVAVEKRPWQTTVLVIYSVVTLLALAYSFIVTTSLMIVNERFDSFIFFLGFGRLLLVGAIVFCIFRARRVVLVLLMIQIVVGAWPFVAALQMMATAEGAGTIGSAMIFSLLIFLAGFAFCLYCLFSKANVYWLLMPGGGSDKHAGGYARGYESGYTRGYASGGRDGETDYDQYIEDACDEGIDGLEDTAWDSADQLVLPEELDAWNAFCGGQRLEREEYAVERESDRLGELKPLELLNDCPIYQFLKSEPYLREMVEKTGKQAMDDLRGYEKAPRIGVAGGDCTIRRNRMVCRFEVTENIWPIKSKARLELNINVY